MTDSFLQYIITYLIFYRSQLPTGCAVRSLLMNEHFKTGLVRRDVWTH